MHILNKFKKTQIERIINTSDYRSALKEVSTSISKNCRLAANEASVVSVFEIELFNFINKTFSIKYFPEKEKLVGTIRHTAKGRMDSKIGAVVLEFKYTANLTNNIQQKKAGNQLIEYLKSLSNNQANYLGLLTDGIKAKFIRCENGTIFEEAFDKLSYRHLDILIKNIVLLEKVALTPQNLVKDFCEPSDESIIKNLLLTLYESIKNKGTDRSIMLFKEWMELFRLAHDDKSKQKTIEERSQSLAEIIGKEIKSNDEEYMVLFALQTAYAIIIKIIALKVISKIRFNKDIVEFNSLAESSSSILQMQMNALEEGAIFRSLGIANLLEGDFFSWYSTEKQWNKNIADAIRDVFVVLTGYEDRALFETGDTVYDLFKDLYIKTMPEKVRHSLGEFYTPSWLADNLITEALKLKGQTKDWSGLDPCAGSGTFITVMIRKVLEETASLAPKERLLQVLNRVKAIDLNPLAILTTRINYFINISHLISEDDNFEIPVYLGDASYVPESAFIENIPCLKYRIKTLQGYIDIALPKSAVNNPSLFSQAMIMIEDDIKAGDSRAIENKLLSLIPHQERTNEVIKNVSDLSKTFVELEKKGWNGIWARIVTNFLTTANLGKFDLIVGNPPWIDWKNLPAGYRERIKSICVERHLFSGDSLTGGINLNICALISNVAAENWLNSNGVLAFLMPQTILFQQTYEGFRNFSLNNNQRLYFQQFFDWTQAGHPFSPVQHKFITYFISANKKDYRAGVDVKLFKKRAGFQLDNFIHFQKFSEIAGIFVCKNLIAGQTSKSNTIFSYASNKKELEQFKKIAGESIYLGREGVEFYPQELFLFEIQADLPLHKDKIFLRNYQNHKSKHKIPAETVLLEKDFLHPLIKGVDIERFNISSSNFIVPFPYTTNNYRSPIPFNELKSRSPLLAKHFNRFKSVFLAQTEYNEKIIGKKHSNEFYALARVGKYSFANHYVAFRDNTKWQAVVVSDINTPWGGEKRPLFQNHAVSICETAAGRLITLDEAHYICAILNAPIVSKFILNSSDSRSFKIRPPINLPEYSSNNSLHIKLVNLSKKAHANFEDKNIMDTVDADLDQNYLKLVGFEND